jgi:MFS superfamily sulfate permease-like transporter
LLLTVILDLTLAVEIGMFIAIFSFIQRITALTTAYLGTLSDAGQ